MRRWITIIALSFLLASTGVAASAQAAMAQASPQSTLSSRAAALAPAGPDVGGNVELFAADSGIAAAFAAVVGGILLSVRRRQDLLRREQENEAAKREAEAAAKTEAEFAEKLSSLKSAIIDFSKATSEYRASTRRRAPEDIQRALCKDVQDSAIRLMTTALGCGWRGEKAVKAALQLMEELGIDFDIHAAELAALQNELEPSTSSEANSSTSSDD